MNHPGFLLLMTAAGLYLAKLRRDDRRAAEAGHPAPGALPGVAPAPRRAVVIAVAGALLLLALETAGEFALGLAARQSRVTALFALYSIAAAPVIEETIFRGWLVVEGRGRRAAWAGAVAASVVFAAVHPFLWRWDAAGFAWIGDAKGWFSAGAIFATSLWLYAVRLAAWNPHGSLTPCIAAHAVRNAGVVAIKAALGYVAGWW